MELDIIVTLCVAVFIVSSLIRLVRKVKCKIKGHNLGEGVLWKECKCCKKTLYLHMSSGEYVEYDT